jgi:regulator of sirC expression with transglutaminase-like and TPR domain
MNKDQLPHLLNLIDDDSHEIRETVLRELSAYGTSLEIDLLEINNILDPDAAELIDPIIQKNRRKWLSDNWISWQTIPDETEQLEAALTLLAKFQYGPHFNGNLKFTLDKMAQLFQNIYPYGNEIDLSVHLFQELRIKGDKKNYFNPLNSNIFYAIEEKQGLPIILCVLYMLIGHRCGFKIEGCNFPGHFLTKIRFDYEIQFIDCFNGGKIIYESEMKEIYKDSRETLMQIIKSSVGTKLIVKRIISNLVHAYKEDGSKDNSQFFKDLLVNTGWE